jgi:flagellar hook-basal body complex protein FliE
VSIQSLDAISAYAKAVQRPGIAGVDAGTAKPAAGGTFASMVETIVSNAIETGRVSEQAAANHIQGKAELVDVVTAVNAAEMSLETLVAVRDKMIAAYQDIMRMPI